VRHRLPKLIDSGIRIAGLLRKLHNILVNQDSIAERGSNANLDLEAIVTLQAKATLFVLFRSTAVIHSTITINIYIFDLEIMLEINNSPHTLPLYCILLCLSL